MQATSKEQSIRIASSGGLSEDQIQNMVREAEANAEKDKSVSLTLHLVAFMLHGVVLQAYATVSHDPNGSAVCHTMLVVHPR